MKHMFVMGLVLGGRGGGEEEIWKKYHTTGFVFL